MPTVPEALTMRVTVIGGIRCADDYQAIWRGMSIGRIMLASGLPSDKPIWSWNCYVQGRPWLTRPFVLAYQQKPTLILKNVAHGCQSNQLSLEECQKWLKCKMASRGMFTSLGSKTSICQFAKSA